MNKGNLDFKKLLKGYYEAEFLTEDCFSKANAPDFAFNVLNRFGLLYRPVADEEYLKNRGEKPVWPGGKSFAVCLTHDVDFVSMYSLSQSLRAKGIRSGFVHSALHGVSRLLPADFDVVKMLKRGPKKDPFHFYEKWLEIEKTVDAKSTFFFWPGLHSVTKNHYSDCFYELFDFTVFDNQKCTVGEMIKEIAFRGWEIGLHPSWYSYNDKDELKRQKDALEQVLGHEIVSIRQHYLHYDIRITPHVHAQAGFKYDSTLGFNDNIGFRFGTSYPWYLYDLREEKKLPVLEIPLIVQDGAMLTPFKGMRLDKHVSFEYIKQMADAVEKVGGVLTLLWHPEAVAREVWWDLYCLTLEYLKQKNAWFASVRDVGEYWVSSKNKT